MQAQPAWDRSMTIAGATNVLVWGISIYAARNIAKAGQVLNVLVVTASLFFLVYGLYCLISSRKAQRTFNRVGKRAWAGMPFQTFFSRTYERESKYGFLHFGIVFTLVGLFGFYQEISHFRKLDGPSPSRAEEEASEFLVKTRRVRSERIRTKVVRDAFNPNDPALDYYLVKYEYSTCMGFFKAFWTDEKVFRFSDCTVELLDREPCEQSGRRIDEAVP